MMAILCTGLMLSAFLPPFERQDSGLLALSIKNLVEPQGEIHIALYDSEGNFMQAEKRVAGKVVPVRPATVLEVQLGRFPYGVYAVAIFQDLNNNGQLDKNTLGIPTEPYAFSNNPRAKWRPATFRETRFELRQPQLTLEIELKFWKEH